MKTMWIGRSTTTPSGDVDEGAVLHERGVQCREASAAEVGELAEIPLDDVGVVDQRGGQ